MFYRNFNKNTVVKQKFHKYCYGKYFMKNNILKADYQYKKNRHFKNGLGLFSP